MKALTIYFLLFISFSIYAFTAEGVRTITGTVVAKEDGLSLPGVAVAVKGTSSKVLTDNNGNYEIKVPDGKRTLVFKYIGYKPKEYSIGKESILNAVLETDNRALSEMVVTSALGVRSAAKMGWGMTNPISSGNYKFKSEDEPAFNTESYNAINENRFMEAKQNPLSTFGIDVDAASYSNIRRFINDGQLPPIDAVRIEEMINYFDYEYPQPPNSDPISIQTEISTAPWNTEHLLVKIGLQGKTISTDNLPASNLVFLIDVSGSMDAPNKLPLLKSSMRLLIDQLRSKDKVSIVVYAGAAGQVLEPTSGDHKQTIKEAINKLEAGGSTAGGAGIKLAYKLAQENFIKGGNNRIILATDGDFNIGASSDAEMQRLIEEKRETGVYLTVLGYGMGNYKDSKMEALADKGNGNYAYIDNISEAKKTLVNEFGGTLFTIAKDVKLQVEFNPLKVKSYRLIGYENRLLSKEDFNDDKKDAGDLGSGHKVTALYEIIPVEVGNYCLAKVDDLIYQDMPEANSKALTNELLTVKLRYKNPDQKDSKLISKPVLDQIINWNNTSDNFRFAAAVAGYGMLLRNSEFKQNTNYSNVINWAGNALGKDKEGYRAEFLKMVKSSELMAKDLLTSSEK